MHPMSSSGRHWEVPGILAMPQGKGVPSHAMDNDIKATYEVVEDFFKQIIP